jgi:hypothetical protein
VARRSVAEPCGRGAEGVPKRAGRSERAERSEREDARNERTRGVGLGGVRCISSSFLFDMAK